MDESRKLQLAALLLELSIRETHDALNGFTDKKDKYNALRLIKLESSIDTILEYLGGKDGTNESTKY